jgi:4a-hydroxytetrahydrobiopterin dehydratase
MNVCDLADRHCGPCQDGMTPLTGQALTSLADGIPDGWIVVDEHHLEKRFSFNNFVDALSFTNIIGGIAEEENHHPDMHLAWGMTMVQIWSHKVGGLTEGDFIFAAKTERAYHAGVAAGG